MHADIRHWSLPEALKGRQVPCQRNDEDCTNHWPETRVVELTAAAKVEFFLLIGDATAVPTRCRDSRSVRRGYARSHATLYRKDNSQV